MDLCNIGSAEWEEQPGATYVEDDKGKVTVTRIYQGPKATLAAFLSANPAGSTDYSFSRLLRSSNISASLGDSYGTCTLTFTGQSADGGFENGQIPPVKVKKTRTARTVSIRNETSTGDEIVANLGQDATLTIKYFTALHSVEYVSTTDKDEPAAKSAADLPATLNEAIRLADCQPSPGLGLTEYLGGGFQPPTGLTAKIAAADYKVTAVCANFERDFDGSVWTIKEDWIALIEDSVT